MTPDIYVCQDMHLDRTVLLKERPYDCTGEAVHMCQHGGFVWMHDLLGVWRRKVSGSCDTCSFRFREPKYS